MTDKPKRKPAYYTVDFVTALPPEACRERLEREDAQRIGGRLVPVTQQVAVSGIGVFTVERRYPGAFSPIRLVGSLDRDESSGGTWVHGAITHDTDNQVMVEGLTVFVLFFLITTLLFLELEADSLLITVPLLVLMLAVSSARWRALRASTEDLTRWLRRRLYVTKEQAGRA
ncbi:MAG TPA: hypothetical protein VMT24_15325 [Aggregatilineaceae bacterium]|jgi:hypothetical protein|nr:hypothetical protein [Aggregatilineaceae bacterium]